MRKIFGFVLCLSVAPFSAASLSSCGGVNKGNGKIGGDIKGDEKSKSGGVIKRFTHKMVDLGLPSGLLWATCNVGASNPYEDGEYFAWGETKPKEDYDRDTYKWCKGSFKKLTKYCYDSLYSYNGFTDNRDVLDAEDDAATVNWGVGYRMPTYDEYSELDNNCTWTWDTLHKGYIVTGINGNSIFLPASGFRYGSGLIHRGSYGSYWLATTGSDYACGACSLYFDSVDHFNDETCIRYYGLSVRPVAEP